MSLLVDYFFQSWPINYHSIQGKQLSGLQKWLLEVNNFVIYDDERAPGDFTVGFVDDATLRGAFAADVSRFVTAAFESMSDFSQTEGVFCSKSWVIIRAYYASFFAAHAIIRLLGQSCTNLDGEHALKISQVASLFGKSVKPVKGLYSVTVDLAKKELNFKHVGASGGSHEVAWGLLKKALVALRDEWLTNAFIGSSSDVQQAALRLDDLVAALTRNGCAGGNWLSAVRNKVNYAHEYGVWFPYNISATKSDDIVEFSRRIWLADVDAICLSMRRDGELKYFLEAASMLVAICRESVFLIDKRSSSSKSFVRYGPWSFLNNLKLL